MSEKKNPGRFTLQFNMEDPQQRMVAELLEQQGRHKAQFIASAVVSYIQCPNPQGHSNGLPAIDEATLERMLLAIMEKHPQFAGTAPSEPTRIKETMGDDAMNAIFDTLAAFQQ